MTPGITNFASRRGWLIALLLVVGVFAVYWPAVDSPFIGDDWHAVQDNLGIRSVWPPPARWFRPVSEWTFAMNYAVSGLDTRSYHLVNFLLHALAAIVLVGLLMRTFRFAGCQNCRLLAWLIALIWAVHPLHSMPVININHRHELLAGMFLLASLYCLARSPDSRRPRDWLALSIGAGLLAVASKESAVVLPVLAVLYAHTFMDTTWRDTLRRRWYFLLLFLVCFGWVFISANEPGSYDLRGRTAQGFHNFYGVTAWDYFSTQLTVVPHYLKLAVWPHPLVNHYYGWPIARSWAEVWPGVLLLAAILACCLGLWIRAWWAFLAASFLLLLAPTSFIYPLPFELAAERRMYLPLLALCVLFVLVVRRFAGGTRETEQRRSIAAVVIAGLVLGSVTWARAWVWRDPVELWADALAKRGDQPFALNMLAILHNVPRRNPYLSKCDPGTAIMWYEKGLARWDPANALGFPFLGSNADIARVCERESAMISGNIAFAFIMTEEKEKAVEHAGRAVRIFDKSPDHASLYALALALAGEDEKALDIYKQLAQQGECMPVAEEETVRLLIRTGRHREASERLLETLPKAPSNTSLLLCAAALEMADLRSDRALRTLDALGEGADTNGEVIATIHEFLCDRGRSAESRQLAETFATVAPNSPEAWYYVGLVKADDNRPQQAAEAFRRTLQLRPNHPRVGLHLIKLP